MAWIARALLLAGLMLTGCTMQTPLDPTQADQKIAAALDWLKQNSDYHDPAPLPAWVEQSAEQMKTHATQSPLSPDDRNSYAIYDCPQHTLYLWSGANLKDSIVVSFILHALTHHLQCVQATPLDACTAEREAATLQAKFIRGIPAMFANAGYEPDDALLTSVEGAARRIELNSMMACPPPPPPPLAR